MQTTYEKLQELEERIKEYGSSYGLVVKIISRCPTTFMYNTRLLTDSEIVTYRCRVATRLHYKKQLLKEAERRLDRLEDLVMFEPSWRSMIDAVIKAEKVYLDKTGQEHQSFLDAQAGKSNVSFVEFEETQRVGADRCAAWYRLHTILKLSAGNADFVARCGLWKSYFPVEFQKIGPDGKFRSFWDPNPMRMENTLTSVGDVGLGVPLDCIDRKLWLGTEVDRTSEPAQSGEDEKVRLPLYGEESPGSTTHPGG